MPVERSKLKWDGPPSQKVALVALYGGHAGLALGLLGGAAGGGAITTVCILLAICLYFVAFFLEQRERRRERADQGGPFGR